MGPLRRYYGSYKPLGDLGGSHANRRTEEQGPVVKIKLYFTTLNSLIQTFYCFRTHFGVQSPAWMKPNPRLDPNCQRTLSEPALSSPTQKPSMAPNCHKMRTQTASSFPSTLMAHRLPEQLPGWPSRLLAPGLQPAHTQLSVVPTAPPTRQFLLTPVCGLKQARLLYLNSQSILISTSRADHKLNLRLFCGLCSGFQTRTNLLTGNHLQESHNHYTGYMQVPFSVL